MENAAPCAAFSLECPPMASLTELLAASPALFIGLCVVLGLAVGSSLNVVIYRPPVMLERKGRARCAEMPLEASATPTPAPAPAQFNLVGPRSACPACRAPISALQN